MNGKKHYSQMTDLEIEFLLRKFFSIPKHKWQFTKYALKRFETRNIDPKSFETLWLNPSLIEFHKKGNSNRILLRSNCPQQDGYEVCGVFDLTHKKIITVWKNWVGNKHQNLVIRAYKLKADVLEVFQSAS